MARYEYQAGVAAFPVPFEYELPEHIGVNLELPTGQEKRLALNIDYVVGDGAVFYVLPKNHALIIFDASPPKLEKFQATALAGMKRASPKPEATFSEAAAFARINEPMLLDEEIAACSADEDKSEAGNSDRLAALEKKLAELENEKLLLLEQERARTADAQIGVLEQTGAASLTAIEDTTNQALRQIQAVSSNATRQTLEEVAQATASADEAVTRAKDAVPAVISTSESTEDKLAKFLASLETRLASLENERLKAADDSIRQIDVAAMNALASLNAQTERLALENESKAALEGNPWPLEGFFTTNANLPASSIVTLPNGMGYYPGRNSLRISVNGYMLIQGRDFEEVCDGAHPAKTIRILLASLKGDLWHFYVIPTNTAQAAQEAAAQAKTSAFQAGKAADGARAAQASTQELADKTLTEGSAKLNAITTQGNQAVSNIAIIRDNAKAEINDVATTARREAASVWNDATRQIRKEAEISSQAARKLWQDAEKGIADARVDAQKKAEAAADLASRKAENASVNSSKALELAQCAWQAAFDASVVNVKPGIASVSKFSELLSVVSGIYIINPLVRGKTPFMGIWPVEKEEDMQWDGIFFIGMPYPDQPAKPEAPDLPPFPEEPKDVPEMQPIAAGKEWLPCGHNHK